jgi:LuxR family maltose regulon positive regulatory protein
MLLENQLLATKFYVPMALGTLISRPRLNALLQKSLEHPITLVSAPAGFGKTTLLSTWGQSLQADHPRLCWVSLDEEDNDPQLFWTYVLSALNQQQPEYFTPLVMQLQSQSPPPLKNILTTLINILAENTEQFLLILDDYHLITEQQVHSTLLYLVQHLSAQLHIILLTRTDPPLLLPHLRARQQVLEVRTDQLRCTIEETKSFFKEVIGIQLPEEMIQEVSTRIEGWLVGLQLLGLSLQGGANPATLLEEVSGEQRYILDYLTEVVLQWQPQDIQTFLLSTCILPRLTASLCDAVTGQNSSQQMLERLEQANLFVVSLDSKHQWYRYHALFAEALQYWLKHIQSDLVPIVHYRASTWYAQHDQMAQAILHAFQAHQWQWAADLIERHPLLSLTWGASPHELAMLQKWLEQLPAEIVRSRPRLCLASAQLLWAVAPYPQLEAWLDMAEATLKASLTRLLTHEDVSTSMHSSEELQDQKNLLGEVIAWHAWLRSYQEDGQAIFSLCQQSLALLSAENVMFRAIIDCIQFMASYPSSANDALAAFEKKLQAASKAQIVGPPALTISVLGVLALYMIEAGHLNKAYQLTQQAIQLGTQSAGLVLPDVGWPSVLQAEILRLWNDLNTARSLAEEAIPLCQQIVSLGSISYPRLGYAVLLRTLLSCGDYNAARSAFQEFERIGLSMNQPFSIYTHSQFTAIDQVKLWLACGEIDSAVRWAEEMDIAEKHSHPLVRSRQDLACVRVLLAQTRPAIALQRLEPLLERASKAQHWGLVIEMYLLQALAYQMCHQGAQALTVLTEVVRLAEPEGYIRSFVDEGAPMAALLSRLRKQQRKAGPTPYLDKLLAAFPQQSKVQERQPKRAGEHPKLQPLLDPLSERELEILQLIARGTSNQEIAQELVIAYDTVKRHVSHIFAKLGVNNRVQAVRQARALGLLTEEL